MDHLHVIVLGAAAGGGFPQWNCNSVACRRARAGDPAAKPRTQASIAVSRDKETWFLLNASPDLRSQIESNRALHPLESASIRSSPIAGVILTGGDIDVIAGLLHLRERENFVVYAAENVHSILQSNLVFDVLHSDYVERRTIESGDTVDLTDANNVATGIEVEMFEVPGKVPLFLEGETVDVEESGHTVGLRVSLKGGKSFFFIPGCSAMTPALAAKLADADLLFFDGTLWSDDEMIRTGSGTKTGKRMGHLSVSGVEGTLAVFRSLNIKRKVFIHINNTNPILLDDSPESQIVNDAGWEVAQDGMEFVL